MSCIDCAVKNCNKMDKTWLVQGNEVNIKEIEAQ